MTIAISILSLLLWSGCGLVSKDAKDNTTSEEQDAPESPRTDGGVTDEDGVVTASVAAGADTAQTVAASRSSAIEGSSVTFPPGSLDVDTQITIERGASIVSSQLALETGASVRGEVAEAGPAVIVSTAIEIDAVSPFSLAIPLSDQSILALAADRLVVFFRVNRRKSNKRFVGVLPATLFSVEEGRIVIDTQFFGAYQAAYIDEDLAQKVELETTAPILSYRDAQNLPTIDWGEKSIDFDEATSVVTFSANPSAPGTEIKKCAGFLDDDQKGAAVFRARDLTTADATIDVGSYKGIVYARFVCRDNHGRFASSPWSPKINTSIRPVTVDDPPAQTNLKTVPASFSVTQPLDFQHYVVKACTGGKCKAGCTSKVETDETSTTVGELEVGDSYYICARVVTQSGQKSAFYRSTTKLEVVRDGTLDVTFHNDGYGGHDNAAGGSGADRGNAVATDANGRIIVGGSSFNGSGNKDAVIWRLNPSGALDTSFADDGIYVQDNIAGGGALDEVNDIAIADDGKIVAVGTSVNGGSNADIVVWRLNNDGTPDASFDGDGWAIFDNSGAVDEAFGVALNPNGSMLVVGFTDAGGGNQDDVVIIKVAADGTLDTSFGSSGTLAINGAASGNDVGTDIVIASNGDFFVVGGSNNGTDADIAVWKGDASGTPIGGFGTGGVAKYDGGGFDLGEGIVLLGDNIFVTGVVSNATGDLVVLSVDASTGATNTTFNGSGVVTLSDVTGYAGQDLGKSIIADEAGRLVIAGVTTSQSNEEDMLLIRVTQTGSLDSSFGTGGHVVHNSAAGGGGEDRAYSVALDANSQIVVVGKSHNGSNFDAAMWRFWGSSTSN